MEVQVTRAVLVDTAALIVMTHRQDALHAAARQTMLGLAAVGTPLVTSDWILTEFLGSTTRGPRRAAAVEAIRRMRSSRSTSIVEATRAGWDAAFDLLQSHGDKAWSLVDCTSMTICREHGISRVFTHDRHFKQAGFEILL